MRNPGSPQKPLQLVILMPVFCDWDTAGVLCKQIDDELACVPDVEARVVLVDDGSPKPLDGWTRFHPKHLKRIDALLLRRNMGHQRAIAMGLCVLQNEISCDFIVVMDADGEDRPQDALRLLNCAREKAGSIIFAERRRRFEGAWFRIGYWAYRLLHWMLAGVPVRAGNFSVLPRQALGTLVTMSELWNHYAGAIYKSKLEHLRIPTDRGTRLGGRSHMNLVALVVHGLSGIATFYDVVATRILLANLACLLVLSGVLAVVFGIRVATNLAIPGWATTTSGLLLVLAVQFASISFSLVFTLITSRFNATFVPARDYRIFIDRMEELWSAPA